MKTAESYINQIIQEELTKMLNEEKTSKEIAAVHQKAFGEFEEDPEEKWKIKGGTQGKGKDPAKGKFYKIPKKGFEKIHKRHDKEYFERQGTGADWDKLTPKEQADWRKKRKESEKPPVKTKPKTPKFFQEELKRIIQEELNELVNYMRAGTNLTTQLAPPHADLPDPSSESTDLTFDNAAENLLTTALQLAQENIGPESSIEPAKLAKVLLKMAVKKTSESDPAT